MSYQAMKLPTCTPRKLRNTAGNVALLCIVVNLLVKIGIIYGFEYKWILIVGSFIDAAGVALVAILGRMHT